MLSFSKEYIYIGHSNRYFNKKVKIYKYIAHQNCPYLIRLTTDTDQVPGAWVFEHNLKLCKGNNKKINLI